MEMAPAIAALADEQEAVERTPGTMAALTGEEAPSDLWSRS